MSIQIIIKLTTTDGMAVMILIECLPIIRLYGNRLKTRSGRKCLRNISQTVEINGQSEQ